MWQKPGANKRPKGGMAVVDTNLLIRVITGDDPGQAGRALELINAEAAGGIAIPDYVFVELAFVLEFKYFRWPRERVHQAIVDVLNSPQITCSRNATLALEYYHRYPKLDFVDCLLVAISKRDNEKVLTFDKDLLKVLEK